MEIKTTKSGQAVVCGTPDEIRIGQVLVPQQRNGSRTLNPVNVVRLGSPFQTPQGLRVYGYLSASSTVPAAPSLPRWRPNSDRCVECRVLLDPRTASGDYCFDCA